MPPIHRPTAGQHLSPSPNPAPVRRLSNGECRDWLSSHREGRLAYPTGRGPRSVVVSYAVREEHVLFRLPDYNDIVHYAPGQHVTLEVDGDRPVAGSPPAAAETVTVTGQAQLATPQDGPTVTEADFEEQWPSSVSTRVICLPMTEVEGYELSPRSSVRPAEQRPLRMPLIPPAASSPRLP